MTLSASPVRSSGHRAALPAPLVCGALGAYDRGRVLAIAAALGGDLRPAHEDRDSMLMLDREPLRWEGGDRRGLGWIEGVLWRGRPSSWEESSRRGACGLAIEGRRRFVHSSTNGLSPVYWTDAGGATYFSSRIDPLVTTSPSPLSVDWDAWAATIALRYPLGERTPFAEIRRLGPHSTLYRRLGRGRSRSHRWPWAEIEARLGFDEGAEAAAVALRDALAPLEGEVLCPLSGGLDSRLLLGTLAALGRSSPIALTVGDDEGGHFEESLAAPAAQRLGVPHERLGVRDEDYPGDWEERARRVEYQFVDHAWLVPLARRIAGATAPVPDGYALDTMLQTGARFHRPDVIRAPSGRAANRALFESLRQYGLAHEALEPRFHAPIVERAREQFLAAVRPLAGHPSQPTLALYAARTVRGISTYPSGLLGREACVVVPALDERVATALLSVSSAEKGVRQMHSAILARLAPQLEDLPSTNDTPREPPVLPRRWRSEAAVRMHHDLLRDGPLAPYLSPALTEWIDSPHRGELGPSLRLGMESVSLLHSWCRRYRRHLRRSDVADLLG